VSPSIFIAINNHSIMAPTTRNQRRQRQNDAIEAVPPIVPASPATNGVDSTKKPGEHIKFDSDDELDTVIVGSASLNGHSQVDGAENEPKIEKDEEVSDDDDAPEAVTMGSGREAARKKEEDARKAIEA
jgi:hypothetical protein